MSDSVDASLQQIEDYIKKKVRGKTDYSDQKQYRQKKHQRNKNNQETKMRRKTTLWIFQATNKRNLTREDWDISKKEKPHKRN